MPILVSCPTLTPIVGHTSRECPKPRDYSRVTCTNCGEKGHTKVKCKQPVKEEDGTGAGFDEVDNGAGGGLDTAPAGGNAGGEGAWNDSAPAAASGGGGDSWNDAPAPIPAAAPVATSGGW